MMNGIGILFRASSRLLFQALAVGLPLLAATVSLCYHASCLSLSLAVFLISEKPVKQESRTTVSTFSVENCKHVVDLKPQWMEDIFLVARPMRGLLATSNRLKDQINCLKFEEFENPVLQCEHSELLSIGNLDKSSSNAGYNKYWILFYGPEPCKVAALCLCDQGSFLLSLLGVEDADFVLNQERDLLSMFSSDEICSSSTKEKALDVGYIGTA
ncbi:hypothetical protein HPP92_010180 [Vanilla planifolia]|uniref:Uncharacterized protein n=1 Tax=Vanilla planifolia TaxID=51239 RepID=A0A835V3T9_VANPL|nr:hypothetical protein HPP92_010180 [Vanilla planifolia]